MKFRRLLGVALSLVTAVVLASARTGQFRKLPARRAGAAKNRAPRTTGQTRPANSCRDETGRGHAQELQDAYRENLRLFHDNAAQRMREFRDVPAEKLRAITAPTLVIGGDRDVVLPAHAVELFRLLPRAEVAILPNTDHGTIMRQPDVLVPLIERFLAQPATAADTCDALKVR